MRVIGLILLVLGFAMLPASCFYLFGSTFAPEGRTMIGSQALTPGAPGSLKLAVAGGKRYRVSVDFMFKPDGFPVSDGNFVLDYEFPFEYALYDRSGRALQEGKGTVIKGDPDVHEHGTSTQVMGDVIVQRWFDWFVPSESGVIEVDMRVDPDARGKAKVRAVNLEVWDDTARQARRGFWAMGVSAIVCVIGLGLLIVGQMRAQSRPKRGAAR